ncbi:hypothetical protein [Apilactobacillus xinyiensis]|uniref:hypothetical protein n=1 Tax=Apilactobacillus xinyiensis TaxID=2841032 RepID=UPI00200DCE07|nr:hypothetical protein [Apilactobacillus xinyiensis]MCL0330579.1 hypothetical protein [Apilactobacillus xinyiensis]
MDKKKAKEILELVKSVNCEEWDKCKGIVSMNSIEKHNYSDLPENYQKLISKAIEMDKLDWICTRDLITAMFEAKSKQVKLDDNNIKKIKTELFNKNNEFIRKWSNIIRGA